MAFSCCSILFLSLSSALLLRLDIFISFSASSWVVANLFRTNSFSILAISKPSRAFCRACSTLDVIPSHTSRAVCFKSLKSCLIWLKYSLLFSRDSSEKIPAIACPTPIAPLYNTLNWKVRGSRTYFLNFL